MSSRHYVYLIAILLSSMMLAAQTKRDCAAPVLDSPKPTAEECKGSAKTIQITISCDASAGGVLKPLAVPTNQHMCAGDSVDWVLDPRLKTLGIGFIVTFEDSPFNKRVFSEQEKNSGKPTVHAPEGGTIDYHYRVRFTTGESEDPHIIIH